MPTTAAPNNGLLPLFTGKRPIAICTIILSVFLLSRMIREKNEVSRPHILLDDTATTADNTMIDTERTQKYAFENRGQFRLKAKEPATERLFGFMKNIGMDSPDSVILVGGTHDGQYAKHSMLEKCPSMTFYGFEIVQQAFEQSQETLASFEHVSMLHLGWDEKASKKNPIGGSGQTSGLYDPAGQRGWTLQKETADTVSLAQWTTAQSISQTAFVLIETEGREPKVLRGMELDNPEYRQRFPLIQYELGATWAERDNRHGKDPWDQRNAAQYLIQFGYRLYLIGQNDWLQVNADFFSREDSNLALARSKNFGRYVQGNVLAVHPEYNKQALVSLIEQRSRIFKVKKR